MIIKQILMSGKKKILIAIILSLFLGGAIVSLPIIYSISDRLAKTSRVEANILLVEGWLLPYYIEMAYDEFKETGYDHVITTGIRISGYFQVSMNGYLIFYTHGRFKGLDDEADHTIAIDAYSEAEGEDSAHFKFYVNDSLAADFFSGKKKRLYEITWRGRLSDIDSVLIQFDNDRYNQITDRNLYVKEIIFDNEFHISYQYNSEYDVGSLDGVRRVNNNFSSHAELARNTLLSMGLDSSLILAIPGKKVRINRTLSSALAFSSWLKTTDIEVKGINIVTQGTHAGRTLMTYNKILDKKYEIGIISLPDYREHSSRKYKVLKTLRETFGLVYYWLILIPY